MTSEERNGAVWRTLGSLILLTALMTLTRLGAAPLWDRDEPRNARCAVEMAQAGDWVVPLFNGELRAHKPVLLYWLIGSAHALLGVNEFAARIWSALFAIATVLATYRLGCTLMNERAALWAAVALATSPMFLVSARAATPDAALVLFTTLALTATARGLVRGASPLPPRSLWLWCGLATLAKGPVGLVLPLGVVLLWWFAEAVGDPAADRWQRLASRVNLRVAGYGAALYLAIVLPWFAAVGARTDGRFLTEFWQVHHLRRALTAMEGHHGWWPVYYPVSLLVGTFPWSVLASPLIVELWRCGRGDRVVRMLLAWIAVYVIAFSLAATKLPSYVLPCYPALALLLGRFINRLEPGRPIDGVPMMRLAGTTLSGIGAMLTLGLLAAALAFSPTLSWAALAGLPLIAAGWRAKRDLPLRIALAATTTWLFVVALLLPAVGRLQPAPAFAAAVTAFDPAAAVVSYGPIEPSWVYYRGATIQELPLGPDGTKELRRLASRAMPLVVVSAEEDASHVREALGDEVIEIARLPRFLRSGAIVALARRR